MAKSTMNPANLVFRSLLGLLMLVPGLMKLFVMGPDAVTGMLTGIGFPAPMLFAWILIVLEIGSGAAILMNWKVKYATLPPMVILLVATIFVTIKWSTLMETQWSSVLLHLVAVSGYWVLMSWYAD